MALEEFWESQHAQRHGGWLTDTSGAMVLKMYDLSLDDFADKQCLEIGVGKGTVTKFLAYNSAGVYGCDISATALQNISGIAQQTWLSKDIDQIPPVDVVLCHLVFVHCDDLECLRILRSIKLKQNGRMFCQFSSFKDPVKGPEGISAQVNQLLDLGNKHFFREPQEIDDLIISAGFTAVRVKDHDPGSFHGWTGQYWRLYELCRS